MNCCSDVPELKSHRTATTVCFPDTNLNDVARFRIVLPSRLPIQRFLLAAYHGSWSSTSSVAAVTFELWTRCYYPNIRDKLVAKVATISKVYKKSLYFVNYVFTTMTRWSTLYVEISFIYWSTL